MHEVPAWPLQEACHGSSELSQCMNISIEGDLENVRFDVLYGSGEDLVSNVDWDNVISSRGVTIPNNDVAKNLFSAVKNAVAIWFNVTKTEDCFNAVPAINKDLHSPKITKLRSILDQASNKDTEPTASSRQDVCTEKLKMRQCGQHSYAMNI